MKAIHRFTWTALLAALIILLGVTPIGLIPLGFINVTILCLPVIIGTLLLGLRTGLVLGAKNTSPNTCSQASGWRR